MKRKKEKNVGGLDDEIMRKGTEERKENGGIRKIRKSFIGALEGIEQEEDSGNEEGDSDGRAGRHA